MMMVAMVGEWMTTCDCAVGWLLEVGVWADCIVLRPCFVGVSLFANTAQISMLLFSRHWMLCLA